MSLEPHDMCFGLNAELDRRSIDCFLQLMGNPALTRVLSMRMDAKAIEALSLTLTGVLRQHLSEDEYHTLFLQEASPHHQE